VVTHTGKIFHPAAANENHGMLLQVVPDSRDV
jgi:hypothetical protein